LSSFNISSYINFYFGSYCSLDCMPFIYYFNSSDILLPSLVYFINNIPGQWSFFFFW
jgi:hypothetical protein